MVLTDVEIVVTEMPEFQVAPGATLAEMKFHNSDGTVQTLRFSPDTMMTFVNKVFEVFLNEKLAKDKEVGYASVEPLWATSAMAQEAVGGNEVVVGFRLDSGMPLTVALTPDDAETLHKKLGLAVKAARRQFSDMRH